MTDTPASLLQRLSQQPDPADWERFVRLFTPLIAANAVYLARSRIVARLRKELAGLDP